jgi:hypothetical protein
MKEHSADIFNTVCDSVRPEEGLDAARERAGASRALTVQTADEATHEEEEAGEEEEAFSREALHCVRYVSVARGTLSEWGAPATEGARSAGAVAAPIAPPILRIASDGAVRSAEEEEAPLIDDATAAAARTTKALIVDLVAGDVGSDGDVCAADERQCWRLVRALQELVQREIRATITLVAVSVILCTVTYYANRAHNLTRSP